jgi:hypothetical protein
LHSYVIGLAYKKIFPLMCKRFENENQILNEKLSQLRKRGIDPYYFGAQKLFKDFNITSNIVNKLSSIETEITPLEKLNCLKNTLDLISQEMKKQSEWNISLLENKLESIFITSDDLIPTVICTLCSSQLNHFVSHIEYIQTFSWYLPRHNELAYSLVTFEAAQHFISNYNLNDDSIYRSESYLKLEQTLKESSNISSTHIINSPPFDHELERIGKMIDSNTNSKNYQNSQSPENNEDLG